MNEFSSVDEIKQAMKRGESIPPDAVIRYAQEMIAEAIAAEREACAKIADGVAERWFGLGEQNGGPAAEEVAAAIRERGTTP